jgi:hypothetical protein
MKQFKNNIFSTDFGPAPFNFNKVSFLPPSLTYVIPLSDGTFLGLNSFYLNTLYDSTINDQSLNAIKLVKFDSSGNILSFQQHSYKNNSFATGFLYLLNVGSAIYVYGPFNNVNDVANNGVVRLSLDGTIDNTFTLQPVPQMFQSSGWVDMKVSISGKIYLRDNFNVYRINNDGSLDNTFTPINIPGRIQDFDIDNYVLTDYTYVAINSGTTQRYTPNGTLDPAFNFPFVLFNTVFYSICVGGDGKLYCNGGSGNANYFRFFRLNSNGTIDTSFNLTNVAWSNNASTLVKVSTNPSRNTVIFVGPFSSVNSTNTEVNILEYNYVSESVLNNTFSSSILFYVIDLRLQTFSYLPANNIMIARNTCNYSDNNDSGFSVLNMLDNSIVYNFNIKTKITGGSNPSTSFNFNTDIINDKLYLSVSYSSSNNVVSKYSNESFNRLIRLNLDSTIDNTFNPDNVVNTLGAGLGYIVLSNGNIAYIGNPDLFRIYNSTSNNFVGIVKYQGGIAIPANKKLFSFSRPVSNNQVTLISHTDTGATDTVFGSKILQNFGGVFSNISYILTITSGKHLVRGNFNREITGTPIILNNAANTTNIVVYNSNGSVDVTSTNLLISLSLSTVSSTTTMYETSDGKILILTSTAVYRFNSDLTLDISFDANNVGKIVLSDNKYYINVGGTTLTKYNYDGTIDTSFITRPLSFNSGFFVSGDFIYDLAIVGGFLGSTVCNTYKLNGTIPPFPR